MKDVTSHKSAEEALRQEEEKYRALIETTGTGFAILDDECTVLDANLEYVRLTGRSNLSEVVGHNVTEWTVANERSKKEAAVPECLSHGSVRGLEIEFISPSGAITPVEVSATVVRSNSGTQVLSLCRDVSQRREADRKLRETERLLSDVIGFLPDATFAVDLSGSIIVWNHAMEELTSVKAVDMMHKGNYEYSLPLYGIRRPALLDYVLTRSDELKQKYLNVRAEGDNVVAETHLVLNGRKRFAWLKASPLYDDNGTLVGAIETIRDVTAHKKAEEALVDAESFVKGILNSIGTGVVIVDAATHEIVDINDCALRLIGTDRDAAVGRVCHRFICPAQKGACPISDLKKTVDNSERVLLDVEGRQIPILKSVVPVTNQGKSYLIESFWNITELKRAEKALKLDEARLSALLQLHQMINATESEITHFAMEEAVRLTESTIGYIAFVDETEAVLTMYAWSSTAMKECRIQDKPIVYPLEKTGLWGEAVRQRRPILTNNYAEPNPLKKGIPDGHVWIGRHMNVPIFDGGRIVIVAGVGNKTTDYDESDARQLTLFMSGLWSIVQRKRSQEQALVLQDKLERAQRMESLGVLAGGVAHDLNNMLGPVAGFSELVLHDLPNGSKLANRVTKIMKSAQDAADVIQDLLTLARRGRYEMCPLLLNDVITSYLESPGFAKLKERHPDVKLELALAPDLRPISGSHVHLSKVIMNLVANACEAMTEPGTLSLHTELHRIKTLFGGYARIEQGDYVVLKVRDTGVGIGREDLAKIFEPYYSKKKMGHSGSGLGLSVVYGVTKDHGGYYDVFSEPGQGTEFVLYFPACGDALPTNEDQVEIAGGTEHVLIVDDSPDQRDLAKEVVSTLGYRVDLAENGHEALSFLRRQSVDIVMLDMIMESGFDGLDTYREILKIRPDQKVVIVSGFSATERVQAMQEVGAGIYVRKPYSMNTIAKALREELGRPPRKVIVSPTTQTNLRPIPT